MDTATQDTVVGTVGTDRAPTPAEAPGPPPHPQPRRVAVVFNPASGGETAATRRDALRTALDAADLDQVAWLETTPDDPGTGQARKAVDDGAELVIAMGGDGTVMAVATALVGGPVPLAVVPFGTGNLVAANFDIPTDPDKALEIALACRRRRVDVGRLHHRDGDDGGDVFVIAAGIGFDAAMLRDAPKELKSRVGVFAYVFSAFKHVKRSRATFRLRLDGKDVTRRAQGVLIANLGRLQGGIPLLPDAVPDDGVFDVAVMRTRGVADWAVVGLRVLLRWNRPSPLLETFRASRVELRVAPSQPIERDGDPYDHHATELVVEVQPDALTIAVPTKQAEGTAPVRKHEE